MPVAAPIRYVPGELAHMYMWRSLDKMLVNLPKQNVGEVVRQMGQIIDPSREHDWSLDTVGSSGNLYYFAVSTLYLYFNFRFFGFSSMCFILFISQVWSKMDILLKGKGKRELAAIRTGVSLCIVRAFRWVMVNLFWRTRDVFSNCNFVCSLFFFSLQVRLSMNTPYNIRNTKLNIKIVLNRNGRVLFTAFLCKKPFIQVEFHQISGVLQIHQ